MDDSLGPFSGAPHEATPWFQRAPNSLHIGEGEQFTSVLAWHFVALILDVLSRRPYAVVTTSSGRTFRPAYARIRDSYRSTLDWSRVICVQMDEYEGLSNEDCRSMAWDLTREFIEPLGVGRFITFFDAAGSATCTLDDYERTICDLGGIDCAFHGVGRNGHVALNEPGALPTSRARIVSLTDSTREANGVSFRRAVTLGLATLRAARDVVIVLRGQEKRRAAQALLYEAVAPLNPIAYLRDCKRVSVFLDQGAAPERLGCVDSQVAAGCSQ
jgi:glucosamine-6-phosphate deaminase